MKKYIGIALVVFMVLGFSGMAMTQPYLPRVGTSPTSGIPPQTVKLTVHVLKFITVNPAYAPVKILATIDPGTSGFSSTAANVGPATLAYSNCPFSVTLSGDPTLKRVEHTYGGQGLGRYDYLWTSIAYTTSVNSVGGDSMSITQSRVGLQGSPGSWSPLTAMFTTPHNGLVTVSIGLQASLYPNEAPDFSGPSDKSYLFSQDAGIYKSSFVATYTAL